LLLKKYRDKNPIYRQSYYVKERYNITVEELQAFVKGYLKENGPTCAICKKKADVVGLVKAQGKKKACCGS
jgi:hypothetical protein